MKPIEKTVVFWGVCDLTFFVIYAVSSTLKGGIPYYTNLIEALINIENTLGGSWSFAAITFISLALFISIPLSGILLVLRKPSGAWMAYCQTPFRVVMVTPSIYFAFVILGRLDFLPPVAAILLFLISEIVKIYTLMKWQRNSKKPANHPIKRMENTCAVHE
ncbi:hypothetical protein [Geopsychrobacter electrodiphilus]|uniref:hypothetical protein n=1 Tax=Geopsychrobacter electrodiphilus TaxID=225196 RepID=UPI00037750C1|nr:hypothetical protein [Geopsychrobacter electrodiphilus]